MSSPARKVSASRCLDNVPHMQLSQRCDNHDANVEQAATHVQRTLCPVDGCAPLTFHHKLSPKIHISVYHLTTAVVAFLTLLIVWLQVHPMGTTHDVHVVPCLTRHHGRRVKLAKSTQPPFPELTHMVLVACHAVFVGADYTKTNQTDNWVLLPYQKLPEYPQSFMQHIELGVEAAASDPSAMLIFSGGKTRKAAGARSEGESYWLLAEAAGWFGNQAVRDRAITEGHARDSFENLLFSMCRFVDLTGQPPKRITIVSYDFKRFRFIDMHRAALRYPVDRVSFLGTPALNPDAAKGEAKAVEHFFDDPYGCKGELLKKRTMRDPFLEGPYNGDGHCLVLQPLLQVCASSVVEGPMPWDSWTRT